MVKLENRIGTIITSLEKHYHRSFGETELKLSLEKNNFNSDPMVHRKLEICNDVERNPGPNTGGKTPINDNPRVSKIG